MKSLKKQYTLLFLGLIIGLSGKTQALLPEFNMTDTVITECKGILYDSEQGNSGTTYDNNENYTLTINTGAPIQLSFMGTTNIEPGLDVLSIYNGPSTASPLIGSYSGVLSPFTVSASSGVMTLHFTSDNSVAYSGWEAHWTTMVPPPTPPVITVNPVPACNTNQFTLNTSYPVSCSEVENALLSLTGNQELALQNLQAINCQSGMASSFQVQFDLPLNQNCPYFVSLPLSLPDACDSLYNFVLTTDFTVNSCPLTGQIIIQKDTACAGECQDIEAAVDGCLNYQYNWGALGFSGPGPHQVCPTSTNTYSVTITDASSGNTTVVSKEIALVNPEINQGDTSLCQSVPAFDFTSSNPGGVWSGPGIIDTLQGTFFGDSARGGNHEISYTLSGCTSTLQVHIDSIDAGLDQGACTGTPTFLATGSLPSGGVWSGSGITAAGVFNPSSAGSFPVTYTQGGCSDTKFMHVGSIVLPNLPDTLCQSADTFHLNALPMGGYWLSQNIRERDSIQGVFNPNIDTENSIIEYVLEGCTGIDSIYILPANIGPAASACPTQAIHQIFPDFDPPGGTWSGNGIIDNQLGTFDPSLFVDGDDVQIVYAAPNGCFDTIINRVRFTRVEEDSLLFCENSDPILLDHQSLDLFPRKGEWMGSGISIIDEEDYFFDPTVSGAGSHTLTYLINTCTDTMRMIVFPSNVAYPDTSLCSDDDSLVFGTAILPSYWQGNGITDEQLGVFDPSLASDTNDIVFYTPLAACRDTIRVIVQEKQIAQITGVSQEYCFIDSLYSFEFLPPAGTQLGTYVDSNLNPSVTPAGDYAIYYSIGSGRCQSIDTAVFTVHEPLSTQLTIQDDSLCPLASTPISITATGGNGNTLSYSWSNGLDNNPNQILSPSETTMYTVQTSDGCSEDQIDSVEIVVFTAFSLDFNLSDELCYGELGFVEVTPIPAGNYNIDWGVDSIDSLSFTIQTLAGELYNIEVLDLLSGCTTDTLIRVPAHQAVVAQFTAYPNLACIPFSEEQVGFLDLSQNAVAGTWTINEVKSDYILGETPTFVFEEPGEYEASLLVQNSAGCLDSTQMTLCVSAASNWFVPDGFSPNGDGANDVLYARVLNYLEMNFKVYDRWGALIFESIDTDVGWDGTKNGKPMPSGTYVYVLEANYQNGTSIEEKNYVGLFR